MINNVFCFVGEKNDVKYLKIDKGNKKLEDSILSIWNKVFSAIKYNIKKINHEYKSQECEDFQNVKNLVKLKLIMMIILIKLNLLIMIFTYRKINLFSNNNCYN